MYDIAVIGAGPAGLTAGIYGTRANKKVIVFEMLTPGGQIVNTSTISNYPVAPGITGPEFGQVLSKQAEDLGVEIEYAEVSHIDKADGYFKITTEDDNFEAKTIIIATGTQPRKLELEHEDEFTGKGISYCATCDGAFYKDKVVAVNGGGNSALHEALYLADIASKVYLVHRRTEFRGSEDMVEKIKAKGNVELVLGANIAKLNGDKKLTSVETDTGQTLDVDGLFVSIGRVPNAKKLIDGLEVVDGDYVAAGENCITNIPGVFVAGDVRNKELRQLVTATSDGAIAANEALKYLSANN
ncbi:FAD-dependent oxidoreductase [Candidatus Saccharibacteria bacterium]|nr:FAD-dependent oxidoreductase [Candidatus Saccharibacteria bacterium]